MTAKTLLYLLGYTVDHSLIEGFSKQRIGIFPHTSYFEAGIVCLAALAYNLQDKICFACAYQYIDSWITGWWLKYFGGFAVRKGNKTTESTIEFLKANPNKTLAISPEGSLNPSEWKKGFFYIAKGTGIPIAIWGIDFSTHTIKAILCDIYISEDDTPENMIPKIQEMFSACGIAPLYPEKSNPKIILPEGTHTSILPLRGKIFFTIIFIILTGMIILPILHHLKYI